MRNPSRAPHGACHRPLPQRECSPISVADRRLKHPLYLQESASRSSVMTVYRWRGDSAGFSAPPGGLDGEGAGDVASIGLIVTCTRVPASGRSFSLLSPSSDTLDAAWSSYTPSVSADAADVVGRGGACPTGEAPVSLNAVGAVPRSRHPVSKNTLWAGWFVGSGVRCAPGAAIQHASTTHVAKVVCFISHLERRCEYQSQRVPEEGPAKGRTLHEVPVSRTLHEFRLKPEHYTRSRSSRTLQEVRLKRRYGISRGGSSRLRM
jgi:hypothetical protein